MSRLPCGLHRCVIVAVRVGAVCTFLSGTGFLPVSTLLAAPPVAAPPVAAPPVAAPPPLPPPAAATQPPKPSAPKPTQPGAGQGGGGKKPSWGKPPLKGGKKPGGPTYPPAGPLPFLPSIGRVRVEVNGDQLLVTTDVRLPLGDYRRGTLRLFSAFSSTVYPRAVDVHITSALDGELDVLFPLAPGRTLESVPVEVVPKAAPSANVLLGSGMMRGFVAINEAMFRRFTEAGQMAVLQIRQVLPLPEVDAEGNRGLVLPLGASNGQPLSLSRVEVVGERLAFARASLCSPRTDSATSSAANSAASPSVALPTGNPVPQGDIALTVETTQPTTQSTTANQGVSLPSAPSSLAPSSGAAASISDRFLLIGNRSIFERDPHEHFAVAPVLATRRANDALCIVMRDVEKKKRDQN
jgi:hypothetical protein